LSFDTLKSIYDTLKSIYTNTIYINTLKCIEWQRLDDGHYRPKHV